MPLLQFPRMTNSFVIVPSADAVSTKEFVIFAKRGWPGLERSEGQDGEKSLRLCRARIDGCDTIPFKADKAKKSGAEK
jgi:hypothetical protein